MTTAYYHPMYEKGAVRTIYNVLENRCRRTFSVECEGKEFIGNTLTQALECWAANGQPTPVVAIHGLE